MVVDEENPNRTHILRDINIMTIGGKECTRNDWVTLLGEAHYDILEAHPVEVGGARLIEAVYNPLSV